MLAVKPVESSEEVKLKKTLLTILVHSHCIIGHTRKFGVKHIKQWCYVLRRRHWILDPGTAGSEIGSIMYTTVGVIGLSLAKADPVNDNGKFQCVQWRLWYSRRLRVWNAKIGVSATVMFADEDTLVQDNSGCLVRDRRCA